MSRHTVPTVGEYVTVTRSIHRPVRSPLVFVHRYPHALFDGGGFHFERPFMLQPDWPAPSYRAPARLRTSRWGWHSVVVEIQLVSPSRAELHLRPASMRIATWWARRQQRYFDAAHRAADELAALLDGVSAGAVSLPHPATVALRSPAPVQPAA